MVCFIRKESHLFVRRSFYYCLVSKLDSECLFKKSKTWNKNNYKMMVYVEKQNKQKTNPQLPADSLPPSYLAFKFRAGAQQGVLWVGCLELRSSVCIRQGSECSGLCITSPVRREESIKLLWKHGLRGLPCLFSVWSANVWTWSAEL